MCRHTVQQRKHEKIFTTYIANSLKQLVLREKNICNDTVLEMSAEGQDIRFYYMFETNLSGHNKIWRELPLNAPRVYGPGCQCKLFAN